MDAESPWGRGIHRSAHAQDRRRSIRGEGLIQHHSVQVLVITILNLGKSLEWVLHRQSNMGRCQAALAALVVGSIGAGCFFSGNGEEDVGSGNSNITETNGVSAVLASTLILESGCTAAKVGPRHLLTAARCVEGKDAFDEGKTIRFDVASSPTTEDDDDTGEVDDDTGSKKSTSRFAIKAIISKVHVHSSYATKCERGGCEFRAIGASDAEDIALIVLDDDLTSVKTIPIDLDAVGQSDSLLAIGSGCTSFDGTPTSIKTYKTVAVPAKTANHAGSPYVEDPDLLSRLGAGYVVTAGVGWQAAAAKICQRDTGAPLFRAGQVVVAGVTSNFTSWGASKTVPVTVHHTRVDTTSKVGPWLETLGVETTRSCSESTAGCVKKSYDGGVPSTSGNLGDNAGHGTTDEEVTSDASTIDPSDGGSAEADPENPQVNLPEEGNPSSLAQGDDHQVERTGSPNDYDAGTKKKKKKKVSGCSAAPGDPSSGSNGMVVLAAFAMATAVARRRRVV